MVCMVSEASPRTSQGYCYCSQHVSKMRLRLMESGERSIEDVSMAKIGALKNWSLQTLGP